MFSVVLMWVPPKKYSDLEERVDSSVFFSISKNLRENFLLLKKKVVNKLRKLITL